MTIKKKLEEFAVLTLTTVVIGLLASLIVHLLLVLAMIFKYALLSMIVAVLVWYFYRPCNEDNSKPHKDHRK